MKTSRRRFLALGTGALGAAVASPSIAAPGKQEAEGAAGKALTNWAGNYTYSVDALHSAGSVEEVQAAVRSAERLRTLGTRHCFNGIADSAHKLVSVRPMVGILELDTEGQTVTVGGGTSYGQLCPELHERGFALHNLASLPHISIAGAAATATHGSGVTCGNLATAVSGLEIVTAAGEVRRISRESDPETFPGAVVHLGALGVITKVTLDVEPTYSARQCVYLDLPTSELREHLDEILSAGYSVSLFTDWQQDRVNEVWVKSRVSPGVSSKPAPELFGGKLATRNVHPIVELSAVHCTEQMGVPGPWYDRLPHFRMGFTPSSGEELQSEYFVPRRHALEAFSAIERLRAQVGPHLMISEVRTVAADDLWMSTAQGRDTLAIHFTWKQDWPAVKRLLPLIERELGPFDVRPHWGKLFTIAPRILQLRYPKLDQFKALVAKWDPNGKFRNRFLESTLYG